MNERPILVTGGAGFIGSNFVLSAISGGSSVVTLDALTYAGNRANLASLNGNKQHVFIEGSIADSSLVAELFAEYAPRAVVNFAAESHVDRSIDGASDFIQSNIVGVFVLLEAAHQYVSETSTPIGRSDFRFLHVSTDEVYGSTPVGAFNEDSRYDPSSPYAATKAAADHLVRAWHKTYDLPTIITNCSNNYGPYQFPEKLIPLMTVKALCEEPLPIYGNGKQRRDWIHVSDHCRALEMVLAAGKPGETYNVGGGKDIENLFVVRSVCAILDRLRPRADSTSYFDLVEYVEDRPGHDVRYSVDASKLHRDLGWAAEIEFETGLEATVTWYLENTEWIDAVRSAYSGERLGRTN